MKRILSTVACLLLVLTVLAGCSLSKTAITSSDFESIMKAEGFQVVDATEDVDGGSAVLKATFATKDDLQYEYYLLSDTKTAQNVFESNKYSIEEGSGAYSSVNGSNYATFSGEYDGKYYYIAYVEDTMIYVEAEAAQKADVKAIIEKLGY